jgi:hypothetical protein
VVQTKTEMLPHNPATPPPNFFAMLAYMPKLVLSFLSQPRLKLRNQRVLIRDYRVLVRDQNLPFFGSFAIALAPGIT